MGVSVDRRSTRADIAFVIGAEVEAALSLELQQTRRSKTKSNAVAPAQSPERGGDAHARSAARTTRQRAWRRPTGAASAWSARWRNCRGTCASNRVPCRTSLDARQGLL